MAAASPPTAPASAGAAPSPCGCRWPGRSRGSRRRSGAGPAQPAGDMRYGCWSWTTTWTPPRAWPRCWNCRGTRPASPTTATRRCAPRTSSVPRSCSWTSACRARTATRWRANCAASRRRSRRCWSRSRAGARRTTGPARRSAGFDHHLTKPAGLAAVEGLLRKWPNAGRGRTSTGLAARQLARLARRLAAPVDPRRQAGVLRQHPARRRRRGFGVGAGVEFLRRALW